MGYVLALLWLVLFVYCLVDVVRADEAQVRNLPKVGWILLVVLLPFAGSIAWLVAGRPAAATTGRGRFLAPRARRGPTAPDDDPEFLAQLARSNAQRERERRAREQHDEPGDEPPAGE